MLSFPPTGIVVGTVKRIVCEVEVDDGQDVEIVSLTRVSTAASAVEARKKNEKAKESSRDNKRP
jgi:hypothetical protein